MASSSNNFADTLNANFKEVYASKIENLIPEGVKLVNKIPFSSRDRQLGNLYHQPVILGHEHGVTFAGPTDDAFNLEAPVSGLIRDAQVRGSQMVLRSVLGYAAASRASGNGQKAFEDSTKFLVSNMLRSLAKKLEITLMYGQVGYGTVASTSGNTVTVSTPEWAPGIWAGSVNMPIEIRNAAGTTSRGTARILSVDMDARTLTLDLLPAGVVATDVIWHKGMYENDFAGIHKILTNTGTIFGINAGTYDLFKGNTVTISPTGALSFAVVQDAIARAVEKGLDSDVVCLVNPRSWSDLLTEQAALRQYDSSYQTATAENGAQEIVFYAQNGKVEIIPSIYVKEGYAYVLCMDDWMRIGSTDITFRRPGQGEEFFRELENSAGYELRAYTDQALFTYSPGKNTLISGIQN
jgi:hypothetical protein